MSTQKYNEDKNSDAKDGKRIMPESEEIKNFKPKAESESEERVVHLENEPISDPEKHNRTNDRRDQRDSRNSVSLQRPLNQPKQFGK